VSCGSCKQTRALSRLVADLSLDRQMLHEIVKKAMRVSRSLELGALGVADLLDQRVARGEAVVAAVASAFWQTPIANLKKPENL